MNKLFAILIFVVMLSQNAFAQLARDNYNYLDFNQKPYYFGITLAYNRSDFLVKRSKDFILNDTFRLVQSNNGPGFNLGVVSNLKIGEYFDVRFLPTLSFAERNLYYKKVKDKDDRALRRETFSSVLIEMPFHLRYKSAPYHDKRLFVVAGVKYSYDVATNSKTVQSQRGEIIRVSPTDFSFEVGAGIQMYFPYFIFSPEIKFSRGLTNQLIYNAALPKSTVLDQVISQGFTISFHFEG
jgi:hypothetical protein